jgi:hypothetical protein
MTIVKRDVLPSCFQANLTKTRAPSQEFMEIITPHPPPNIFLPKIGKEVATTATTDLSQQGNIIRLQLEAVCPLDDIERRRDYEPRRSCVTSPGLAM